MSSLTDPSPPKRERARVHEHTVSTPSPSEAAKAIIVSAVASLPTPVQSTSLELANKSLAIFKQISERKKSLVNLEREDYLPRSLRSTFHLNASKGLTETAEFIALQRQVQLTVSHHQSVMKTYIVSAAKMEIDLLHRQLAISIVTLVGYLSKSCLILNLGLQTTDQYTSAVCSAVLRSPTAPLPVVAALSAAEIQQAILPYSASPLTPELDPTAANRLNPIVVAVSQHINDLCTLPCSTYTEQETANLRALQVTALNSLHKHDTLAAATAIRLDDEPTVHPELLETVVNKAVNKAVDKALKRRINQLSLNGVRGAVNKNNDTFTRASLKKKTTQGNNNNQKAAAAAVVTVTGRLKTATAAKPTPTHRKNQRTAATDPRPAASARDSADANKTSRKRRSSRKSE
jgi:hypothetical protein